MSARAKKRERGPMDFSFEAGRVPCDEPPGLEEMEYRRWKEAGGQVASSVPQPAQEPPEAPKRAGAVTDPALRLAAKLDRLLAAMPRWAQEWAIRYLVAKYLPIPESPDLCA